MRKIVILGAGYAGILCAKKLEKSLKKLRLADGVEISIIDRHPFHTMLTELHEAACHRVPEDSIKISLKKVFAGRKVKIVTDTIERADYKAKKLIGTNGEYSYDYLVMSSGSQPAYFGVEGAKENALKLWSYEDAVKLREHIPEMFRRAASETNMDEKRKLLTFFVVGAGFTGVETVGELAELVPILCERFEIDRRLVKIVNVDLMDRVCTILPPKLSAKVQKRLEKMGVELMLKTGIAKVGTDSIELKTGEKTTTIPAHTVVWAAGVEASEISKSSSELGAGPRGRVQTDEYLRSVNDSSVYIGGDNIHYTPEGEKSPVPQMVENSEASAETIAHNIIADLSKKGTMQSYKPKFHGVMVCVGGRYGVANVGLPGKFFSLPSFFAMFAKHFINLVYFVQVLGWNKISDYLGHEFFTIRNKRSFVGGHFSNRSPSFMLVPLRIFLGAMWLYEGLQKVGEGWLKEAKLQEFFAGANSFYDSILKGGADVVSSATSEVAAVGKTLIDFNIFNLVKIILVESGEPAFKIQVGAADLVINKFVLGNITVEGIFQYIIVLSEIAIGLALIAGLFTTLSSLYSLVLQMLFVTSTGLFMSSWWMIFAAVALLFGGGRALSLDYYFMPWLKARWKKINFVKKRYIYND